MSIYVCISTLDARCSMLNAQYKIFLQHLPLLSASFHHPGWHYLSVVHLCNPSMRENLFFSKTPGNLLKNVIWNNVLLLLDYMSIVFACFKVFINKISSGELTQNMWKMRNRNHRHESGKPRAMMNPLHKRFLYGETISLLLRSQLNARITFPHFTISCQNNGNESTVPESFLVIDLESIWSAPELELVRSKGRRGSEDQL